MKPLNQPAQVIEPGNFEPENHYYPKVLNAQVHPLISYLFNISHDRIISRYVHLHPMVNKDTLARLLSYQPRYLPWSGADLFYVTTKEGNRRMVLIEVNSCPSGQKSMPLLNEHDEEGGYRQLMQHAFLKYLKGKRLPEGRLAVIYDKNYMENLGYAASLANLTGEPVLLCPFFDEDGEKFARFQDGVLQVKTGDGQWHSIRAAFRYVTQKPWNRIPAQTKTAIFNPTVCCLAGGRNKMVAAKAYDLFNAEVEYEGLKIQVPETITDVSHMEIPLLVKRFGGHAVIKVPYSNAGQGVFTITSQKELDEFMAMPQHYDQYIVQSLIGNLSWSSHSKEGQFYHVGTVPNKHNQLYVADLRMMIMSTAQGFKPLAIYARRAREPLTHEIDSASASWNMLGTNLSIKTGENQWQSDAARLMIMDRKDFNSLGIGIDDLIEAFFQTVFATVAIDKMADNLINKKGQLRMKMFRSLDNDENLLTEIRQA